MRESIAQIIKRLCPDGVEYVLLEDLCLDNKGGGTPSRSEPSYWNGNIPWASVGDLTASDFRIQKTRQSITEEGLKNSSSKLIPAGWVVVAVKISPGTMRLVESDVAVNQDIRGLHLCEKINANYLIHYFESVDLEGVGSIVKSITNQKLMKVHVPLPPLEVQQEIARVLDKFVDLNEALTGEIEGRERQFTSFRDSIFESLTSDQIRSSTLGQQGFFIKGHGLQKSDLRDEGFPAIHYGQIHTQYQTSARQTHSFIEPELATKLRQARPGDVLLATTSEDIEAVAKAVAWLGDENVSISGDAHIYRSVLDPKYVSYFFSSHVFQHAKMKYITGAKVVRLSAKNMEKIQIPVPSLEVQQQIACDLDTFADYINNLKRERELRQKQYEGLREQLLTFPKKVSA